MKRTRFDTRNKRKFSRLEQVSSSDGSLVFQIRIVTSQTKRRCKNARFVLAFFMHDIERIIAQLCDFYYCTFGVRKFYFAI
jgi:hypothetical protein